MFAFPVVQRSAVSVPDALIPTARDAGDESAGAVSASESPSSAPEVASAPTPEPLLGDDAGEALGTTRRDRLVLCVLLIAAFALMLVHYGRMSGWGTRPVEVERQTPLFYEHRLDANTASWVEWMQLEGIGETLARRIVADREANGPFESVDDLARVRGIGSKTVEKLRPWLEVSPPGDADSKLGPE